MPDIIPLYFHISAVLARHTSFRLMRWHESATRPAARRAAEENIAISGAMMSRKAVRRPESGAVPATARDLYV